MEVVGMGDFGFYGKEAEEEQIKEIHGITDVVTEYTYTGLDYPCIIFKKGFSSPMHKMSVISNMVKNKGVSKDTTLYFEREEGVFKIGKIGGIQVESLLDIIGLENLLGFLNEKTKLEGSKMYILCTC